MAKSMEDLISMNFMEDKEKLIVHSRSKLKALCEELGISNQRRVSNEFSAIIVFIERGEFDSAQKLLDDWKEDKVVTKI